MVSPLASVPHRRTCTSVVLLFALIGLAWAGPAKTPGDAPESVVAIGDVHGDFDDFVSILQHAGLIDPQHHWTGGKPPWFRSATFWIEARSHVR